MCSEERNLVLEAILEWLNAWRLRFKVENVKTSLSFLRQKKVDAYLNQRGIKLLKHAIFD